jgi:hypothetical protein
MGGRDTARRARSRRGPAVGAAIAIVLVVAEVAVAAAWLAAPQGDPIPVRGEALPLRVVGDPPDTPWLALAVRKHTPRRYESYLHLSIGRTAADADAPRATPRAVRETMLRRTIDAAWVAANDLAGTPVPTYVHALVGASRLLDPYTMIIAVDGDPTDVPAALARAAADGTMTPVVLTIEEPRGRRSSRSVPVGALGDLVTLRPWRVAVSPAPKLDLPSRIRGGSIGLVAGLLYLDRVTPGDLAGGALIAASGAIDPAGSIGRVTSLPWKLDAAAHVGADVVLVPAANVAELEDAAHRVVAVDSLARAVGVLCERGAGAACAVIGVASP